MRACGEGSGPTIPLLLLPPDTQPKKVRKVPPGLPSSVSMRISGASTVSMAWWVFPCQKLWSHPKGDPALEADVCELSMPPLRQGSPSSGPPHSLLL